LYILIEIGSVEQTRINGLAGNDDSRTENIMRARTSGNFRTRFRQASDDLSIATSSGQDLHHLGSDVTTIKIRENQHVCFASHRRILKPLDFSSHSIQSSVYLELAL